MTTHAPLPAARVASLPRYQPGRPAGAGGVKLSSNEDPYGPLPEAVEAAAAAAADAGRYPDHTASALREAIAAHHGVPVDGVTVGCGSVALLQQLALAFTGEGDEVAFPWPSFIAYPQVAALAGATAVRASSVDALADLFGERTRLVFVANPDNPTSTAVPTAELAALADRLPADCLLVVDEAYREYVTDPAVSDAVDAMRGRPNVAVLRTFSKAHALAGLRVGYLVGDPSVVRAVDATLIPFSVSAPAQAAALASLARADVIAARARRVAEMRDALADEVRARGLEVPRSQANFLWLPTPDPGGLALALEGNGVVVRPLEGGVRVTIGQPEENERFLAALDAVYDSVRG